MLSRKFVVLFSVSSSSKYVLLFRARKTRISEHAYLIHRGPGDSHTPPRQRLAASLRLTNNSYQGLWRYRNRVKPVSSPCFIPLTVLFHPSFPFLFVLLPDNIPIQLITTINLVNNVNQHFYTFSNNQPFLLRSLSLPRLNFLLFVSLLFHLDSLRM